MEGWVNAMAFYKKRVVRRDTPSQIEERIRYRRAAEQAFS